jgi:hypothetical protein
VSSSDAVEDIVRDAFEDVALLIGGTAALHAWEDDAIWALVRRLDRVRARALSRLAHAGGPVGGEPGASFPRRMHPAVEGFLRRNQSTGSAGRRSEDEPCASGEEAPECLP